MARTYKNFDDVYTLFMDTTRVDSFQLPQTPQGMYALLEYGISQYKIDLDSHIDVDFDRDTEMLSTELKESHAMLVVRYMRRNIFQKLYDEFVSTYDVLVEDIGIRNYKSQADARQNLIEAENREIKALILKIEEDFDVIDDIVQGG